MYHMGRGSSFYSGSWSPYPSSVARNPLYCRYGLSLQDAWTRPLSPNFGHTGDCRCPACGVRLGVESKDSWLIRKRNPDRSSVDKEVEFAVTARFVVKCHNEDGEFACVLCSRFRDNDIICQTPDALIRHLARDHGISELRSEADVKERKISWKEKKP